MGRVNITCKRIALLVLNVTVISAERIRRHRHNPSIVAIAEDLFPFTNGLDVIGSTFTGIDDLVQDFTYEADASVNSYFTEQPSIEVASVSVKDSPGVFTPSCADRNFWDKYSIPPVFLQLAEYFKDQPIPPWNDTAYLLYSKTGDRLIGQNMLWSRESRLPYLVLAECKFYNGSFLEAIESSLVALATQRAWSFPAADGNLEYFYGTRYFMDLSSAGIAENIGFALFLLDDILSPSTKTAVIDALNTRVFIPLKMSFEGKAPWQWWVTSSSNHNAVIWAGVMSASFCTQNLTERSFYAKKAIQYSTSYLNSFMADGYASEGVGYFNYGFTNYAVLRKLLYDGTNGTYDTFAGSKASNSALFAKEFGMSQSDAANFGDCHFDEFFNSGVVRAIDESFLQSKVQTLEAVISPPNRGQGLNLAYYLPKFFQTPIVKGITTKGMYELRRYYNTSGVLVVRSNALNNGKGLAATFKLGGNLGGHSHNDIGSYVISLNAKKLTGDVGGPLYYDGNTFNKNRYKSPLMNSYGHPLPVVNGALQIEAKYAIKKVKVVSNSFTDSVDKISFNITGAYAVSKLKSLIRSYEFDRLSQSILIYDIVKCSSSCTFQEALVTKKNWTFTGPSTGFFVDTSNSNIKLHVEVISSAPFVWNSTLLTSYKVQFTRIGVYLEQPTLSANVTFKFTTVVNPSQPSQPTSSPLPKSLEPSQSSSDPTPSPVSNSPMTPSYIPSTHPNKKPTKPTMSPLPKSLKPPKSSSEPTQSPVSNSPMTPSYIPSTHPSKKPTKPPMNPLLSSLKPSQSSFEPTQSPVRNSPMTPSYIPSPHPSKKPTKPIMNPLPLSLKPSQSSSEPTQSPVSNSSMSLSYIPSIHPSKKPTKPTMNPLPSSLKPSQSSSDPTQSPVSDSSMTPSYIPSIHPRKKPTKPPMNPLPSSLKPPQSKKKNKLKRLF